MGAWHATYANLLRARFGALVAYAELLTHDRSAATELAQDATVAVFSRRRAPRDTQAAEVACREWMAREAVTRGAPQARADAVRFAIDSVGPSLDDAEVAALRRTYAEASAVYATPSGGTHTVMAPARARRRSAMGRFGAGAVACVAVLAGAIYVLPQVLPKGSSHTSPSAQASGSTASASPVANADLPQVTWNPEPDFTAALSGFDFPACGEKFAPAAQAVGGITPKPSATVDTDPQAGKMVFVSAGFVTDESGAHWLLSDPGMFVVTRDDIVVMTSKAAFQGLDLFMANAPSDAGIGFNRAQLCDGESAFEDFNKEVGGLDYATATQDEIADYTAKWDDFYKDWQDWEPGTYRIYQVSPMVFGEQAALAAQFRDQGVENVSALPDFIAWTALAEDPRVAPYCTGTVVGGDIVCAPPTDVLNDVLTLPVDPATVADTAPGMGISEPLVFDWN